MALVPDILDLPTQGIETIIEQARTIVVTRMNSEIETVYEAYNMPGSITAGTVNMPNIPDSNIAIVEAVTPLSFPFVFIIGERSEVQEPAQNFSHMIHTLLVVVMIEDVEAERLARGAMRMGLAAYRAFHDQLMGNSIFHVKTLDYSPVYGQRGPITQNERNFRKDVSLRIDVMSLEGH